MHQDEFLHNYAFLGVRSGSTQIGIRGSGIIVQDNLFITCAHVYKDIPDEQKKTIFVGIQKIAANRIKEYTFFPASYVGEDTINDLSLFHIEKTMTSDYTNGIETTYFCSLEEINKLQVTDRIHMYGFPLPNEFLNMGFGITLLTTETIVSAIKYRSDDQTIDFIMIDKPVNPGSSGSPILNQEGKIIGLASATINKNHQVAGQNISISVGIGIIRPSNYIIDLIKKYNNKN